MSLDISILLFVLSGVCPLLPFQSCQTSAEVLTIFVMLQAGRPLGSSHLVPQHQLPLVALEQVGG